MPSKQKTRRRLDIQSVQKAFIKRDEHQLCATPGCRNVIAIWAKHHICTWCRKGE